MSNPYPEANEPDLFQLFSQLPRRLQPRFQSLSTYVRDLVEEEIEIAGFDRRLTSEEHEYLQLAALTYMLQEFFRAGSAAALAASTAFEELGAQGFRVGSLRFTPEDPATLRGERLAADLRDISLRYIPYQLVGAHSLRGLVQLFIEELNHASPLD